MLYSLPRVVIAAPSSGAGKTTVATGLMAALRARGLAVSPHKVGPDYLDPTYHALATGRPGRNLDAYLCGEHRMAPLLLHGATTPAPADVAVIEGVMGMYDGISTPPPGAETGYASTAHVARLLRAPVVLVVDASGQSRSVAALVHGFATFDPRIDLAGVILNRVGSDRHETVLREALLSYGMPVLGAVRRDGSAALPSRHLGLVPAGERLREARETVDRLGEAVARGVDLDAVLEVARTAPPLTERPWLPPATAGRAAPRSRVGVLTGPAFGFVYPENLEVLGATGAEVVDVRQDDEELPDGLTALYLPGGFPEVHAAELAANTGLRGAVRSFAGAGGQVLGECGGLLYLAESLDAHPMCGVLPVHARMTGTVRLGYREARVATSSVLGEPGDQVRAHEFHYSRAEACHGGAPVAPAFTIAGTAEGYVSGNVVGTYLHTHGAGAPSVLERLAATPAQGASTAPGAGEAAAPAARAGAR